MTDLSELFAELPETVQAGIRELGWRKPMPVQAKTIPLMREGRDLIVQARTGSGKTGAFGIAIVEAVDPELAVTQALVMLPTRELANQVAHEISTLAKHRGIRCLAIYGGVGYGPQIEGLQQGAHVVVGTPGRILDHLGARRLALDQVRIVIFDEADEMLSLGFWPDMREIRSYLPAERQSHLFSATIPEKVRSLSRAFLRDAQFVSLSEGQVAPESIEHYFYVCTAQEKESLLARILEYEDPESAIIFCNTRADVRFVTGFLQKRGFDADQISGELSQAAREQAIGKIKQGTLRFLVATDVAARGIDISDLSHVISYAAPESPEMYVHRTGRTGRVGKAGVAISMISGLDIGNFRHLQNVNRIEIQERAIPSNEEMQARMRERLEVKVEREMRALPDTDRRDQVDRWIPIVETLTATSEGKRDLAAVCAAYLREHRPETTVREDDSAAPSADAAPRDADGRQRGSAAGPGRGRKRRPRRRESGRSH
ncbi:MAG: DEAD/DEAH box helicase [Myxococcota bacterium]